MDSEPYRAFRSRWEKRKHDFAQVFKHDGAAQVISVLLEDFEAVRLGEVSGEVGISGAVVVSGYSESSIWRFIDAEDIPNVGEPGRPRVRIRDLPFKPRLPERPAANNSKQTTVPHPARAALGTAELELIEN